MNRLFGILLALAVAVPAAADTFVVVGSIQDGFSGPAEGATVTFCEYGGPSNGFVEVRIVPADGLVTVVIPFLPAAVAFEVEGDPNFEDVHVVVAQPICPVSPCNPNQGGSFEIRLQRRADLTAARDRARFDSSVK